MTAIPPAVRADLAPSGTLRAGVNYGNFILATKDSASGESRGVAIDLTRELGRRLGVPVAIVAYDSVAVMVDAVKTGAWDIAFLGIDPAREGEIGFTAAYLEIEATYLVPAGSPIGAVADVDREGVRVAAPARANYELYLARHLTRAQLVRAANAEAAFNLLVTGQADVLAGLRQALIALPERLPGARVLDGRFMAVQQAVGMPRGRDAGLAYLRGVVEDSKASGLVARAIERTGARGVSVAPRAAGAARAAQSRMIPEFLYGTAWKEDRTAALTELALRAGFRGIDTANQRRHYFEAGVGAGLAAAYRAGVVSRADLFLQTKFTYQAGQDHRLPYDPAADLSTQVAQSLASSLEHLATDHVDSFVLHGPASGRGWTPDDAEVWAAMARERDAGRARLLGVSNVSPRHLQEMAASGAEAPAFVQNRCFARTGWDREVRALCAQAKSVYQGFSLLTANLEVLRHPLVAGIAARGKATPAQVVFRFAQAIGMLPLTGTTDPAHMRQDLESGALALTADEVRAIESLAATR